MTASLDFPTSKAATDLNTVSATRMNFKRDYPPKPTRSHSSATSSSKSRIGDSTRWLLNSARKTQDMKRPEGAGIIENQALISKHTFSPSPEVAFARYIKSRNGMMPGNASSARVNSLLRIFAGVSKERKSRITIPRRAWLRLSLDRRTLKKTPINRGDCSQRTNCINIVVPRHC